MTDTITNNQSVRLQILKAIEATFLGMTVTGSPTGDPGDPWGVEFSTVEIGPLIRTDQRKRFSIGIVTGHETEKFSMPYVMCFLEVNIEFRVTINQGDEDPGVVLEEMLTVVKRGMIADRQWGGLAIDTKITGSEIDLITYADRAAYGVCVATIQYRYDYNDPRSAASPPGA